MSTDSFDIDTLATLRLAAHWCVFLVFAVAGAAASYFVEATERERGTDRCA
jgi:hypothetical protein